jgi:hypothetical protein
MSKHLSGWLAAGVVAAGMFGAIANAQLQKATPEELGRRGMGPPAAPTGASALPASTDPRNFAGSWRQARGGGPPGGFDPNTNPAGNRGSVNGQLPDRILCLPQSDPTYTGVDGPTLITQTPEQIIWAAEEMHHIRRIFLVGAHTPNFKPNYLGEAVGRWDGNTLVVETQGLRTQAVGAKLVERWSKNADGTTLSIESGTVDASGNATGRQRTMALGWSSGAQVYEWMCEDYNEEWLPGGTDFDDQVAR